MSQPYGGIVKLYLWNLYTPRCNAISNIITKWIDLPLTGNEFDEPVVTLQVKLSQYIEVTSTFT